MPRRLSSRRLGSVHGRTSRLESRLSRLESLRRYGLRIQDCFHGEEPLRGRIAERLVPPALSGLTARTRAEVEAATAELLSGLAGFDATLAESFRKSQSKMLYQVSKIDRKVAREALRRDERAARDAAYLYAQIYPHKHLQERFYSILPFLARHGLDLPERLYKSISLECPDHQVMVL